MRTRIALFLLGLFIICSRKVQADTGGVTEGLATNAYKTVQQSGASLTKRQILNFAGAGVTCVDNSGSSRTDCTVTSGGGGGGAASLEVFNNFDGTRSSPTASIGMSNAFRGTVSGSTYTFSANTSSITLQGNAFNTGSQLLQLSGGLVPNANVDASSITKQGNAFNGANQLIQLNGSSQIPALDGSLELRISSLNATGVGSGTYGSATQVSSFTVGGDGRVTGAANVTISLINSNLQSGTYSNVTVPAANVAAGSLGGSVIASSIAVNAVQDVSIVAVGGSKITGTATIPNAAIDGSSVTKQGNTFNGASQLVQLNGSSQLPAVDASLVVKVSSLAVSGVPSGSYGSSTQVASLTVNAQGQLTAASNVAIAPAASSITGTIQPSQVVSTTAYTTDDSTYSFTFSISSGTGYDNLTIPGPELDEVSNSTITLVTCETEPIGSTVTFSLTYQVLGKLNSAGTSIFSVQYSTANSDGKKIMAFANAVVPSANSVAFVTPASSSAGASSWVRVTVWYKKPRH